MSAVQGVSPMDNEWWRALATGVGFGAAGGSAFGLLKLFGKAVAWLVERSDVRLRDERVRLDQFRDFLDGKAKDYRVEIEHELAEIKQLATDRAGRIRALENDVAAIHRRWLDTQAILLDVTTELQLHASDSANLARARRHLEQRFPGFYEPVDRDVPEVITELAERLDR